MNTQLPVEPLASRKNYSLIIMGISNGDGDGGGDRWRWLQGHFPVPAGCRNRDFLSPESPLWWWRRCRTFRGQRLDYLGFYHREASYRRRGDVRGWTRGPHHLVAWPGGPAPPHGVASPWPLSVSSSGSVSLPVKYRLWLLSGPIPRIFIFWLFWNQKQKKIGNWHYSILLIGQFQKMCKNTPKCGQNIRKQIKPSMEHQKLQIHLQCINIPKLNSCSSSSR